MAISNDKLEELLKKSVDDQESLIFLHHNDDNREYTHYEIQALKYR